MLEHRESKPLLFGRMVHISIVSAQKTALLLAWDTETMVNSQDINPFHKLASVAISIILALSVFHPATLRACSYLTINGSDGWYPYFYRTDDQAKGLALEFAMAATKPTRIPVTLGDGGIPLKRLLLQLESGSLDILAGATHSLQRAKAFHFSPPVSEINLKVFTRNNAAFRFNSMRDLLQKRGAKILGMNLGDEANTFAHQNLVIDETISVYSLFKMLEVGRVDYIIMPEYAGVKFIKDNQLTSRVAMLEGTFSAINVHIALSKNSVCQTALATMMNTFPKLRASESFERIKQRYLSPSLLAPLSSTKQDHAL